jgi:hypothetical protein
VRLIAFLKWYDERPDWLAETVASLACFVDELVAVDGAYALYPNARAQSPLEQAEAIVDAAAAAELGLTLHRPTDPWAGNEIHKQGFILRLVRQVAVPGRDWVFGIDGDERVSDVDAAGVRGALKSSELDVGEVALWEERDKVYEFPARRLFRVLPRLSVRGAHYVYTGFARGRRVYLWGHAHHHPLEPAEDLSPLLRLEHRRRAGERALGARGYYAARDAAGLEELTGWRK